MLKQNIPDMARRQLIHLSLLSGASALLPRISVAYAPTDARLVFIILRGAMDGLAAVAPYGDGNYQRVRAGLALSSPGLSQGALKLDGLFALNPALTNLYAMYQNKELLVLHAVASAYRERSHFDGQDLLENGSTLPHGAMDGWLNRALNVMPAAKVQKTDQMALAFSQSLPLVMRGDQPVGSWAPSRLPGTDDDTLERIAALYATEPYFLSRFQSAIATDAIAGEAAKNMSGTPTRNNSLSTVAAAAGRMMRQHDGPKVAVMESGGWDTHANQGTDQGQLYLRLADLDKGIDILRKELDAVWSNTVVMVATEFGRTVAMNGSRGTDHGTASCAFLVGGAVNGGRVMTDWPSLSSSSLYQGRDLQPTMDLRSAFKGVLAAHMGVSEAALESRVFANSQAAKPLLDLIRKV